MDPWEEVARKYKIGSKITGTVTSVTDFGVFVELEEGIEGLVHVSEISREKIKTPVGKFNVGDVISAKVVNINRKERKIGLSIRKLDEEAERAVYTDYASRKNFATSNLGELLRDKLESAAAAPEPETPEPETPELETSEPETPEPATPEPETPELETSEPETTETETPEPETKESGEEQSGGGEKEE
jgi:predicted RNA-binding protein with RPS1 domain